MIDCLCGQALYDKMKRKELLQNADAKRQHSWSETQSAVSYGMSNRGGSNKSRQSMSKISQENVAVSVRMGNSGQFEWNDAHQSIERRNDSRLF